MTRFSPVWRGMVGGVLLAVAGINAVTALFAHDSSERVYRILVSALFIVVGVLLLRSDDRSNLN